eukprot:Clim_evm65s153 gene=Clim_evmTU65s153
MWPMLTGQDFLKGPWDYVGFIIVMINHAFCHFWVFKLFIIDGDQALKMSGQDENSIVDVGVEAKRGPGRPRKLID